MKRQLIFLPFLILCLNSSAQEFKFPKKSNSSAVGIPGTRIMIDQGEVSVGEWLSFVYSRYERDEEWKSLLPDTNRIPKKYRFMIHLFLRLKPLDESTPYEMNQYRGTNSHHKYYLPLSKEEGKIGKLNIPIDQMTVGGKLYQLLDIPIVGITFEQAQLYLDWRTENANKEDVIKKTGSTVKARMMTKEEWSKHAAILGPHQPWNKTTQIDTVNDKGCYLVQVKQDKPCPGSEVALKLYGPGAVSVYSYNPDNYGLYNLFGNVSEMTQEKGIAIGASYKDYAIQCNAAKTITYTQAEEWLGFRCVLEFVK